MPQENATQEKSTQEYSLTSGGFTMNTNGDGVLYLFDASGKEIIDVETRMTAIQQVSQAFPAFASALQGEATKRKKEVEVITAASSQATATFAATNDNNVEATKVGYTTKASEKLPFPVKLLGITEEDGQKTYHYTARINIPYGTWYNNNEAIQKLNNDGEYEKAGFGKANLPTNKFTSKTNELGMLHENKEALGITDNWIWGESRDTNGAYYLHCNNGSQNFNHKDNYAAVFPVWRVNHLVI